MLPAAEQSFLSTLHCTCAAKKSVVCVCGLVQSLAVCVCVCVCIVLAYPVAYVPNKDFARIWLMVPLACHACLILLLCKLLVAQLEQRSHNNVISMQ